MARLPRFELLGHSQHVIIRGNNRQIIFVADEDYVFYLEKLAEACDRYDCQVHAYVLMTNHVHLLMTPLESGAIGKVMQSVGRRYVQYFNHCYQRTGTLWEGRYKSALIDSDRYALTCYRYIEMNPVRAGMVQSPAEYRWSSYHTNALGKSDELITPHELYSELAEDDVRRQQIYRELVSEQVDASVIDDLRRATNKGWAVGSERFKTQAEKLIGRRVSPSARGGDRKSQRFKDKKA
ncbi:transposase [Methylophaga sp. OBS4]|uniref:transposase n=1 Tax=Methylophaga sp. OBS4 TaxID=2991935 RepID=UPI00224DD211|nr:transposase [Methylophaga sp. OBS4]MCX4187664.1 transposase [Methylophaga sp. OBS4]